MTSIIKHGHAVNGITTTTYEVWHGMRSRCLCKTNVAYPDYGGRGITICKRWNAFANFLADMGERPQGMSIDRINNDGNYEPGNCRWATLSEQNSNRRNCVYITYKGRTAPAEHFANERGINPFTLICRIRAGWDVDRAVETPPDRKRSETVKRSLKQRWEQA